MICSRKFQKSQKKSSMSYSSNKFSESERNKNLKYTRSNKNNPNLIKSLIKTLKIMINVQNFLVKKIVKI